MKFTLKSLLLGTTLLLTTQVQANFNFGECQDSGQESDITGQTFDPARESTPFERMHHHNFYYGTAGENIAYRGSYPTLSSDAWVRAMEDWMKSHTGHCSNIMNPNFYDFGMAEARGTKPMVFSDGVTRDVPVAYWTQNFGAIAL